MDKNPEIITQKNLVKVFGGHIYSQLVYTQQSKNNIPVITVHGGPGSTFCKMKWGVQPLVKYFPVIYYDQIGGGRSQQLIQKGFNQQSLWTIQNFVNQLQSLINFYNLKKFILFGSSWGCTLSLQYYFANHTTPKPTALYLNSPLVSTKVWMEDANILKKAMPLQVYKIMLKYEQQNNTQHPQYHAAMNFFYNKHVCKSQLLSKQQIQLNNNSSKMFNSSAYNYMWGPSEFYCTGTLLNYERREDLAKINIPVMFTCGQFDEARPESVESFHKKVPNSKFHVYGGCSHMAHFQNSQQFRKVFLKFHQDVTQKSQKN